MMVCAGRMTATARADIGAGFKPDGEAWVRGCVQTCDDAVAGGDLDWEFALIRALGIRPVKQGGQNGEKGQKTM
jgi:hypothetical protein